MAFSARRRALLILAAVGVVIPTSVGALTSHRGSKVADDLCLWLNGKSSRRPSLRMGPQADAILADLHETGAPVACTLESSPYADSFFTETAILLQPSHGAAVGLRVSPLGAAPVILGYWTP
jgi:hypothetical protein